MANNRFVTAACGGGWSIGEVECSYHDLVRIFGEPNGEGDDYKVSTSWYVRDTVTGLELEIYDYKATNLYSRCEPSVEAFRALPSYGWHIGGRTDTQVGEHPVVEALRQFISSKR